jgi:hypothetical protein
MSAAMSTSSGSPPLLSNQPQKPIAVSCKSNSAEGISITAPFCDKITLRAPISIEDVFQFAVTQGHHPDQYLATLAQDARTTLEQTKKSAPNDPDLQFKFKGRKVGYRGGHKRLGPDAASTGIYIATRPDKAHARFFVIIEANPARLRETGLSELDELITLLFHEEINFHALLRRATISSIDIALDLHHIEIRDLIFHPIAGRKWSSFFDPDISAQTMSMLKMSREKWTPCLRVYDKSAQLSETGHCVPAGLPQTVRIESRLKLRRPLHKLLSLENPFADLQLGYLPEAAIEQPFGFRNFVHASMRCGLDRALSDVPVELRASFTSARATPAGFWKPEEIWKCWPAGLSDQGLLSWIKISEPLSN